LRKVEALLSLVLAPFLLSGCSSATLADLDRTEPELADTRFSALLDLGKQARKDPDLRAPLAAKARERLEKDSSVAVRLVAARVIGDLAQKGTAAKEGARALEIAAIGTASPTEGKDEVPWLRHETGEFWVKIEALQQLGGLWRPASFEDREEVHAAVLSALTRAIRADREPELDVRIHAARELGLIAPRKGEGLAALVEALEDPTPDVHHHALRALIAIAGSDRGPTHEDWVRWQRSVEGEEK